MQSACHTQIFVNSNTIHSSKYKTLKLSVPTGGFLQLRPHTARLQYLSVVPPFPLVSWAHSAKCFWHISRSLSCPKQPLYQNYPPEENQFVYLWRVLHIRHFKPWLACSFAERTSTGLKHVEEVDRCQQAKEQFKKRWPEQSWADRQHKWNNSHTYIQYI